MIGNISPLEIIEANFFFLKSILMRNLSKLLILIVLFSFTSCGQNKIDTPSNVMNQFEEFRKREKFVKDSTIHYSGIADTLMRPILTSKINLAVEDFRKIAEIGKGTDKEYQDKIQIGLNRFSDIYINLDTEDRQRVCLYFEELMDIVGLESSNGLLNNFMYGFDPTKK